MAALERLVEASHTRRLPLLPRVALLLPLLLLALLLRSVSVECQTPRLDLLARLLPSSYDDSLRPLLGTGQPVVVSVNFRIDLLYAVSSSDETFALDLFMTERWTDPRLSFNASAFSLPYGDSLRLPLTGPWKPDTYFFNAIRCVVSDSLLKLDSGGSGLVTWTRHQSCTFYTPFDLQQFPFDAQQLPLKRLSFFYNSTELALVYSPLGCFQPDPRLDFVNALWDLTASECRLTSYNGAQDEAVAVLYVSRLWNSYALKMIVPMFLIVIVSSLSYFVDPAAAPARVGLSVAIVLTVSTFNLLVSQDLPKINYSTLLDWYVWKCFLFVIAAVAEFAFVNHLLVSKVYPPLIARLVDDFFQWTVPVVWCLSNLIYWPILPSPYLNALFGAVMAAYIAANAYRIYWCYKHQKEGIVTPIKALIQHIRHRLDEGERLAREQLEKQQRHLQRIGLGRKGPTVAGDARRRGRGRGRGRPLRRGAGGSREERRVRVDAGDEDDGSAASALSVVVTPPTPHWARERGAGDDTKEGGAAVEMEAPQASDRHHRALGGLDEDEEEEEEEELRLEGDEEDELRDWELEDAGDGDDGDDRAEETREQSAEPFATSASASTQRSLEVELQGAADEKEGEEAEAQLIPTGAPPSELDAAV